MARQVVDFIPPRRRQGGAPEPDYDTWSEAAIECILSDLGYAATSLANVHWVEPGYGLADGLRALKWEGDAEKEATMVKMAAAGCSDKQVRLYVEDVASEESLDDILDGPVAVLPTVLVSPVKKELRRREGISAPETGSDVEINRAESDIDDIDYQFSEQEGEEIGDDEDDNEYAKYIDEAVEDDKLDKRVWADDVGAEQEYLPPLGAEDDMILKPSIFNSAVDMEHPVFKLAVAFSSMQEVRNEVAQYATKNRMQVKKGRNNNKRLENYSS